MDSIRRLFYGSNGIHPRNSGTSFNITNLDKQYEASCKAVGTLLIVSEKWASKVETTSNDHMERWSWVDLGGNEGFNIRVVSTYRVS